MLHVTNGDSAAGTLRQTSLGGVVLPWRDVLDAGPVPDGPRGELLRARAAFLSGCGWGSAAGLRSSMEQRDRQLIQALGEGQQVVLWFEHDLYDQLQLLDVLTLAATVGGVPELIVVGSFPGRPSFRGLGELIAAELATLWPSRTQAAPGTLAAAASAWDALRRPDPRALAEQATAGQATAGQATAGPATADHAQLPYLRPALQRLLEELPRPGDGLSGTERRALRAIAAGAATPVAAFRAAQDLEAAPFLGDAWFYRTLSQLGSGQVRLIETRAGQPLGTAPPLGDVHAFIAQEITLTRDGERVLEREADRIELLGADRWVGGTHITPGNAWRWDPAAQTLTAPA